MLKTKYTATVLTAVLIIVSTAGFAFAQNISSVSRSEKEAKYIAVLKSPASDHEKARACQELALVGTKNAVPVLTGLLGDQHFNTYARYALEQIEDPSVDAVLRDAAAKLKGMQLVGVIDSIGVRRDTQAVNKLKDLADNTNPEVAKAAIYALGRIANDRAVKTIIYLLYEGAESIRPIAADACLKAAEILSKSNNPNALELYRIVADSKAPGRFRAAGILGVINNSGDAGLGLLIEQLKSGDPLKVETALAALHRLHGKKVTDTLMAEMNSFDSSVKPLVMSSLIERDDPTVLPVVLQLASADNPKIRMQSLKTLGRIGDASAVYTLLKAVGSGGEERSIAIAGLRIITGRGVDDAIIAAMGKADGQLKADIIGILADREVKGITDKLIADASGNNPAVCAAAFKALSKLAGPDHLDEILKAYTNAGKVDPAIERAIAAIANKDKESTDARVINAFKPYMTADMKQSLLKILGAIGTKPALIYTMQSMNDPDLKDTAIRQLANWPNADAMDSLVKIVTESQDRTHKILALRGTLRLLSDPKATDADTAMELLSKLSDHVERAEDKKLFISALANQGDPKGLPLLVKFCDNADVKNEATLAADKMLAKVKGVKIFDGKSFKGWDGREDIFEIRGGAIVGGTLDKKLGNNEFLTTKKEYENFELSLKVKLLGDQSAANAGIQIRSQRIPNHHEMIGYQADMGQHYWGALYDESRRNKVLAAPDKAVLEKALKLEQWNDYKIRCIGKRIELWINGVKTVDYIEEDPNIPQKGLIGLQIHSGPPAEAWYADIVMKEI